MEQNGDKNRPIKKTPVGRFQISLWRNKRIIPATHDFDAEREFISERICIQYSRLNRLSQSWENQQVWCNPDELRDLSQAIDKFGQQEGEA